MPINRPAADFNPAAGLLRNDHFQVAYATNDIERAQAIFRDRYGIRDYRPLKGQMPAGGHIHIELAWVGNTMYELVTATGPGSPVFMDPLPKDGFALRLHHLGFLIYDQAAWRDLHSLIDRDGWTILSENNTPGFMQYCIVDAPELGHYLEFIFPEAAGLSFLENVPGN